MSSFLTVKEAAERTGKSPSSIRRIIHPITKSDAHPDRAHIEPSPEEALKLRMKGENFPWKISEELLQREVPAGPASPNGTNATPPPNASSELGNAALIAMLRRELDIKNAQITQQSALLTGQMELIGGLSERLREGNILIASLSQRLALTDGREEKPAEPAKAKNATPVKTEKGSAASKPTKPKRGLLSRFFRKKL